MKASYRTLSIKFSQLRYLHLESQNELKLLEKTSETAPKANILLKLLSSSYFSNSRVLLRLELSPMVKTKRPLQIPWNPYLTRLSQTGDEIPRPCKVDILSK